VSETDNRQDGRVVKGSQVNILRLQVLRVQIEVACFLAMQWVARCYNRAVFPGDILSSPSRPAALIRASVSVQAAQHLLCPIAS
jgi:hypothetical protein